jgi:hypothetical protein
MLLPAASAALRIALLLNLAQCHLKLSEPLRTIQRCTELLGKAGDSNAEGGGESGKKDGGGVKAGAKAAPYAFAHLEGKDQVKAFYRRASAYASETVHEWELATEDLKSAFALNPEDRAIAKLMAKVNKAKSAMSQ